MEGLEKILDKHAKENMAMWSLESFKKSHSTLFETIIKSMDGVRKEALEVIKGEIEQGDVYAESMIIDSIKTICEQELIGK